MKKNIFKVLMCLIIIILILIIVLYFVKKESSKDIEDNPYLDSIVVETVDDDVIIPNNSYLFFGKYTSRDVGSKEVYDTIYKFASITVKKYANIKNTDDTSISEYYKNNKKEIENDALEINSEKDFKSFINSLEELKDKDFKPESIEFIDSSIVEGNEFTTAKLNIKYNNGKTICVNIKAYLTSRENEKNIVFYN